MTIERWGAFSVIDHKDYRKLATEVLIYDRLLVPMPMDWDLERWEREGWDPEGLKRKLGDLGDIAIPANWDQDRQKDWAERFNSLREDQKDINAALEMTRRVLVDQGRNYRPEDVDLVEVFSAYQSENDFYELDPAASADDRVRNKIARTNFLLSHRLAVPQEKDETENLKRALDLAHRPEFKRRRSNFYEWQHNILSRGHMPEDAAGAMVRLAQELNNLVEQSGRDYRWETVVLVCAVAAAGLATAASLFPAGFVALGLGPLQGAQVVQIGGFATGAVLQIAQHVAGREVPDEAEIKDVSGAMFHQIEQELSWALR
jgi:hypothetical protein